MTADLHLCMMVEFTCWNTQILKTNSGFAIVYVIFYYYNTLFLPNSIPISYDYSLHQPRSKHYFEIYTSIYILRYHFEIF
ncbi:hypothetical protein T08_1072 [Trichinella sp. T8]|nr:hypothetical protein T08_1072 [Trichinella sp. T8]